jgi:hypothetical protein
MDTRMHFGTANNPTIEVSVNHSGASDVNWIDFGFEGGETTLFLKLEQMRDLADKIYDALRMPESLCEFAGCDEPIKAKVEIESYRDAVLTTHMFCAEHSSLRALLPTFTNPPYSIAVHQLS